MNKEPTIKPADIEDYYNLNDPDDYYKASKLSQHNYGPLYCGFDSESVIDHYSCSGYEYSDLVSK